MSAVIERFLICDGGCGMDIGVDNRADTIAEHRRVARSEGWACYSGKDFCPACRKRRVSTHDNAANAAKDNNAQ